MYGQAFEKIQKSTKGLEGTGKTAARLRSTSLAELGRIQAMNIANLTRAREKVEGFGRETRRKLVGANSVLKTNLALCLCLVLHRQTRYGYDQPYIGALGTLAGLFLNQIQLTKIV